MTIQARRSLRRAAPGVAAALSSLVASAPAFAQAQPEGRTVTLDVRAESDVLARSSAAAGFLERLGIGIALGGKTAFIGGATVGAILGSDTFVLVSPYVGARLFFEPRYALDLSVSYQQFIALDDKLEPTAGGFISRESFGYGATAGAAFSVRLSEAFWASASVELGGAAFDHDVLYVSPPSIAPGYEAQFLASGGLALAVRLPL